MGRALLAAAVVFTGVTSAVLVSSTAFASETGADDGRRSVLVGVLDPAGTSAVAADLSDRAGQRVAAFAAEAAPVPPPKVHCPVPGSQFVDSWGFARSGGRRHKGVDMMAPHGTPVIAPVAGTLRASNSALGGIGFYLDDAEGNTYFGSHLASLDAQGWVEAGTQIGTVGSTGNAGTPHLHFEIAPGGGASVNPYPFALSWCLQDDPWAEVPLP
jgi:murein DD-endopeptidase MepM/ murein hydrolase activator NlpD